MHCCTGVCVPKHMHEYLVVLGGPHVKSWGPSAPCHVPAVGPEGSDASGDLDMSLMYIFCAVLYLLLWYVPRGY